MNHIQMKLFDRQVKCCKVRKTIKDFKYIYVRLKFESFKIKGLSSPLLLSG